MRFRPPRQYSRTDSRFPIPEFARGRGGEQERGRISAPSTLNPQPSTRRGFTLIELILVVLIILILATLTVAVVGNMLDSDRVRGASRQIQNYLAGARDRAIYSASRQEGGTIPPRVGVRFLADPSLMIMVPSSFDPTVMVPQYRGFSSMVFVQEVDPMPTNLRVWEDTVPTSPTFGQWKVSQFPDNDNDFIADGRPYEWQTPIRGLGALIQRGLVESRIEIDPVTGDPARFFYLQLNFDDDPTRQTYYAKFIADDVTDPDNLLVDPDNTSNIFLGEGILSRAYYTNAQQLIPNAPCHFRLLPSPMPNEEPRLLPDGVVIDAQSSVVGGAPRFGIPPISREVTLQNQSRADGSFDVMFNAQGVVDGPLASSGLMHFVVADLEDLERGYYLARPNPADPTQIITGNAFVDTDTTTPGFDNSDGEDGPDERQNDVQIVSIRAQTGGVYSSPIDPTIDADPASPTFGRLLDPFKYAEIGGEAK